MCSGLIMLNVKNITKLFGQLRALNNINIEIKKGSIYGIVGPNGAGKTTLFNVMSGIVKPTSGNIYLKGKNVTGYSPHVLARKGLGRTFQIVKPFSDMSVFENVLVAYGVRYYTNIFEIFRKYSKQDMQRVEALIESAGLLDIKNKQAKALPLGYQRRLEIVRALALNPYIILLDESFSGLSPKETSDLEDMVISLNRRDITILIIEHNMPVIMNLCERVSVLNYGVKIAEGTPKEIVNNSVVIEAYLGKKRAYKYAEN